MTSLAELAGRVEQLSGPDREVDALIASALRLEAVPQWAKTWAGDWRPNSDGSITMMMADGATEGPHFKASPYTASIDSAMQLVPEGWALDCLKEGEVGSWYVNLRPRDWVSEWQYSKAATPALALCAAALKARAAQSEQSV